MIQSDGTPERDYLYVEDAVDAFLAVERLVAGARTLGPCLERRRGYANRSARGGQDADRTPPAPTWSPRSKDAGARVTASIAAGLTRLRSGPFSAGRPAGLSRTGCRRPMPGIKSTFRWRRAAFADTTNRRYRWAAADTAGTESSTNLMGATQANQLSAVIEEDLDDVLRRAEPALQRLSGKSVVVAGGAGFLPSYLVDALARANDRLLDDPCRVVRSTTCRPASRAASSTCEGATT